jgi:hypothetical protein
MAARLPGEDVDDFEMINKVPMAEREVCTRITEALRNELWKNKYGIELLSELYPDVLTELRIRVGENTTSRRIWERIHAITDKMKHVLPTEAPEPDMFKRILLGVYRDTHGQPLPPFGKPMLPKEEDVEAEVPRGPPSPVPPVKLPGDMTTQYVELPEDLAQWAHTLTGQPSRGEE